MEPEPISEPALSARSGFTLLEMLAVLLVLSSLFAVVIWRFDLTGRQANHQLKRFQTTLRTLQARALRSGQSHSLTVKPGPKITISTQSPTGRNHTFTLSRWRLDEPTNPFRIHVSPVGIQGPALLRFRNPSVGLVQLRLHRLEAYRVSTEP